MKKSSLVVLTIFLFCLSTIFFVNTADALVAGRQIARRIAASFDDGQNPSRSNRNMADPFYGNEGAAFNDYPNDVLAYRSGYYPSQRNIQGGGFDPYVDSQRSYPAYPSAYRRQTNLSPSRNPQALGNDIDVMLRNLGNMMPPGQSSAYQDPILREMEMNSALNRYRNNQYAGQPGSYQMGYQQPGRVTQALDSQLSEVSRQKRDLESKWDALEARATVIDDKIQKLRLDEKDFLRMSENWEIEKRHIGSNLAERSNRLEEKQELFRNQVVEFQQRVSEWNDQKAQWSDRLRLIETEKQRLSAEKEKVQEAFRLLKEKRASLEETHQSEKDQWVQEKQQLEEKATSLEDKIYELEEGRESLDVIHASLDRESKELEKRQTEIQEKQEALRKKADDIVQARNELVQKKQEFEKERVAWEMEKEKESEGYSLRAKTLMGEKELLDKKWEDFRRQVADWEKVKTEWEKQHAGFQKFQKGIVQEKRTLKADLDKLYRESQSLKAQNQEDQEALKKLATQITQKEKELEAKIQRYEALEVEVQEMERREREVSESETLLKEEMKKFEKEQAQLKRDQKDLVQKSNEWDRIKKLPPDKKQIAEYLTAREKAISEKVHEFERHWELLKKAKNELEIEKQTWIKKTSLYEKELKNQEAVIEHVRMVLIEKINGMKDQEN